MKKLLYHDISQLAGVDSRDRLIAAGFFVLLLHGILILGVTFSANPVRPTDGTPLAVTLVQSRSVKAPDQADYIAQANQRGEGASSERQRPRAPLSNPAAVAEDGVNNAPDSRNRAAPGRAPSQTPVGPLTNGAHERAVATTADAVAQFFNADLGAAANAAPRMLIARLLTPNADTADPTETQAEHAQAPGKNPRDRVISVNTRESRFARYLDNWRKHVVRLGNLNYPSKIRAQHLSGRLTLEVALNADGSLNGVTLVKPSKHAALNAAAIRIVEMGAPYQAFPPSIRKDTDVLRFVYEWRFTNGKLSSGS